MTLGSATTLGRWYLVALGLVHQGLILQELEQALVHGGVCTAHEPQPMTSQSTAPSWAARIDGKIYRVSLRPDFSPCGWLGVRTMPPSA